MSTIELSDSDTRLVEEEPEKSKLFKFFIFFGIVSAFIFIWSVIKADLKKKNLDFISRPISDVIVKPSKGNKSFFSSFGISWNLFLSFGYGLITFGFTYSDLQFGIGAILFLLTHTIDKLVFERMKHSYSSVVSKDGFPNFVATIVYFLSMFVSLSLIINSMKKLPYMVKFAKMMKVFRNTLCIVLMIHMLGQILQLHIFGLTQRLYIFTVYYIILRISFHMTFRLEFMREKKMKLE